MLEVGPVNEALAILVAVSEGVGAALFARLAARGTQSGQLSLELMSASVWLRCFARGATQAKPRGLQILHMIQGLLHWHAHLVLV